MGASPMQLAAPAALRFSSEAAGCRERMGEAPMPREETSRHRADAGEDVVRVAAEGHVVAAAAEEFFGLTVLGEEAVVAASAEHRVEPAAALESVVAAAALEVVVAVVPVEAVAAGV